MPGTVLLNSLPLICVGSILCAPLTRYLAWIGLAIGIALFLRYAGRLTIWIAALAYFRHVLSGTFEL